MYFRERSSSAYMNPWIRYNDNKHKYLKGTYQLVTELHRVLPPETLMSVPKAARILVESCAFGCTQDSAIGTLFSGTRQLSLYARYINSN